MRVIGDPATIDGKEMLFLLDSRETIPGAGWTTTAINLDELLPIVLTDGAATACEFYVGTDVAAFANPTLNLRLFFRGVSAGDELTVALNGSELVTVAGQAAAANYVDFPVGVEQVRYRTNQLAVTLRRGEGSDNPVELAHFELRVGPQE